ncbi:hypothetical protein B0H19DRAFT_1378905 [Mycena capillaripes]|nr:hypothetical protein B0H19DRAFT_1378905 [Mycena capillaripes]
MFVTGNISEKIQDLLLDVAPLDRPPQVYEFEHPLDFPPPRSSANPQPHAIGHAFPTFPDTGLHTYDASAAHATVPLSTAPVRARGCALADSGSGSRTAAGLQGKLNEEYCLRTVSLHLVDMDSQLTLVDPAPPVYLTFTTNSMINTTLFRDARPT